MSEYIVWVDCEMTGLETGIDEICEIAVIVTDQDLNPVHEGFQVVVKPSRKAMKNMGEFVTNIAYRFRANHRDSQMESRSRKPSSRCLIT